MSSSTYIPAAGARAFTPVYDAAVKIAMRERQMREHLFADVALEPSMRLLDLACGTGTFAVLAKQRAPDCEIVGVDIDADVLAIARRKAERATAAVRFERRAITDELTDLAPFDRVVASLVMHHLDAATRVTALLRAHGALRPGGRIHVVDFGAPSSRRTRVAFYAIQLLDGFETTADSVRGTIPNHLRDAGFEAIEERRLLDTTFGTVRFWSAQRR